MKKLSIITLRTEESISDFAKVRNEELSKVKTEWVLFVDSDEEVSPALKKELDCHVASLLAMTSVAGYKIRRVDRFLGKWLRFGETGNVKIVRLARKDSGQWERPVHEIWNVKGKIGELKNPLFHYHDSVEEMIEKIDRYSSMEAEFRKNTLLHCYIAALLKVKIIMELTMYPLFKFVHNYVFRLGFLDGMEGFILAGLMSFHSFLVRAKQLGRINRHPEERVANDEGSTELDSSSQLLRMTGIFFLVGWVNGELLRWDGMIPVTLMDVATALLLIKLITSRPKNARLPRCQTCLPVGRLLAMIITIGFGSWLLGLRLFSISESIPGLLYLLRILGYLIVIIQAKKLFSPVKKWIYLALITFVILGLGQYVFLPDTRFLLQYGWDEHYYRLIGTVLDPNYMGAMLGVILIWGLAINKRILVFLSLMALVLTYSRASWVATGVGMGAYVIARSLRRGNLQRDSHATLWLGMTVIVILITFGTFLIAPKPGGEGVNIFRTFSIEQRINSWREGISVWKEHPWLGVGFNNYKIAKTAQVTQVTPVTQVKHAENAPSSSWILMLATVGIIGVIGLIWGIREIRGMGNIWPGIAVLISIHAIFNNTLFYTPVLGLIALIRAASEE